MTPRSDETSRGPDRRATNRLEESAAGAPVSAAPPSAAEEGVLEAEVEQFEREARRIAAGGWRRALIGLGLGAVAGVAAALVMPRDEGPRRRTTPP